MAQKQDKLDDIKKDLLKLLKVNPSGIPVDDLATSYNRYFPRNLALRKYGIKGVRNVPYTLTCFEIVVDQKGTEIFQLKKQPEKIEGSKKPSKSVAPQSLPTSSNTGGNTATIKTVEKTEKVSVNSGNTSNSAKKKRSKIEEVPIKSVKEESSKKSSPKSVGNTATPSAAKSTKTIGKAEKLECEHIVSAGNISISDKKKSKTNKKNDKVPVKSTTKPDKPGNTQKAPKETITNVKNVKLEYQEPCEEQINQYNPLPQMPSIGQISSSQPEEAIAFRQHPQSGNQKIPPSQIQTLIGQDFFCQTPTISNIENVPKQTLGNTPINPEDIVNGPEKTNVKNQVEHQEPREMQINQYNPVPHMRSSGQTPSTQQQVATAFRQYPQLSSNQQMQPLIGQGLFYQTPAISSTENVPKPTLGNNPINPEDVNGPEKANVWNRLEHQEPREMQNQYNPVPRMQSSQQQAATALGPHSQSFSNQQIPSQMPMFFRPGLFQQMPVISHGFQPPMMSFGHAPLQKETSRNTESPVGLNNVGRTMSPAELTPDEHKVSWGNITVSEKKQKKTGETTVNLGDSDWPTLSQGFSTNLTKKQMKEYQQVETESSLNFGKADASKKPKQKESKKDQKAETENRRIKFEHLDAPDIQQGKGRRRPTRDELNSRALFHIQALSEQNEHVSIELVMKGVLEHFGQTKIQQLGLKRETDLDAIHNHQRLLSRINAYISAFCKCRSIATLYELFRDLQNIQDGKESFEDLNVGPLCKFSEVYNLFKFPPYQLDEDIIKVTTMDILGLLRDYMSENNLWRKPVNLEKFMEYIIDHYGVSDPYQLGIRVQSVGLGVSVIKKAQREEKNTMDQCRQAILEQLKQETEASLQSVKKSILEPASIARDHTPLDNRRRYSEMTAGEAVLKIFEKALPLLEHEPRLRNFCRSLPAVVNNELARNLFHLAICLGNMDLPQEYQPIKDNEQPVEESSDQPKVEEPVCANKVPDEEEIVSDIGRYLDRLSDVPSLLDLCTIETRICQSRNLSSFLDLKKGTFLQFLTKTSKLLQNFGGSILGAPNQKVIHGTPYHPSLHNLMDFIKQCGTHNMNDKDVVEKSLCDHFQTTSVTNLGRGSLERLISKAKNAPHDPEQNCITYQQAICTQARVKEFSNSKVGLRGHQSVCNALLALNSAPLLEDLTEWSHWEYVFKPEHGDLKGFIEKWSSVDIPFEPEDFQLDCPIKIFALETRPGVLVKLASETSVEDFKHSANEEDARLTAGHLVSILAKDGLQNAPLTLLQNTFESALKEMFSKGVTLGPGGPPEKLITDKKIVSFVLDCLVLLPSRICHAVSEVFLNPLSEVIGDKMSKKLLKEACVTTQQVNKLQKLGFLLGIVEWSETFDVKLKNSKSNQNGQNDALSIDIADFLPETDKQESNESSMIGDEADILSCDADEDLSETTMDDSIASTAENGEHIAAENTKENEFEEEKEFQQSDVEFQQSDVEFQQSDVEIQISEISNGEEKIVDNDALNENGIEDEGGILTVSDDDQLEVTTLTPCQEEMKQCKAVVDRIRKEEFGIGATLNKEGHLLMKVQKDRIARSLERLSSELYSKDTHFVLELVQNADDNTYSDTCLLPSLLFQLNDNHITVYNNEKGFSPENIHALCDVGKSTKGKHKYGYIGHKGIGFKSVFRVTSRPEIHSKGFHICFDQHTDPLGYILPTWIGASKPEDVEENDKMSKGWQTRIVLPLKDELCKTNKLLNRFDDIQPSLLLFLHRLRSIQVVNETNGTTTWMKRIDHPKSVIEIEHTGGTDSWLVVKEMININESVCNRSDMESTELALAFPLPKDKSVSELSMQEQYIFAYLPLRSYGFKFIIQGDFDIPSSREDVDNDSAWNQWIRQHLSTLFIKALQFFKDFYGTNKEEIAVCKFLQFVPVEGQILGFFESVAREIHQKLKSFPCLPVVHPNDGSTVWRQPSEAVIVHDLLVQELVSPTTLHRHLGCYYLSNVVSSLLNAALLRSLGVKTITTKNLINLFKGEVLQAKADGTSLNVESVAKWLTCIYRCREAEHDISEEPIKEIQSLHIIPLSNGRWKDLEDRNVFFSLTFENQRTDIYAPKKAAKKDMQGSIQVLESDMYILHSDLLTCQDALANSQVTLMMEQLGVCHITPHDVIHNHIFPVLRSEDWKAKRPEVLVSYVVYIKDQMRIDPGICKWKDLKELVQVWTDRGTFVNPSKEPVHFTKMYGNKYDLKKDLTGGDWTFVHECYLSYTKQSSMTSEITQWRNFFSSLDVLDFIAIERKTLTLQKSAMDSSVWSQEYETWPTSSDGSYRIEDCRSKELVKLIENNTKGTHENLRAMVNLLYILAKEWDHFSHFIDASLLIDNNRRKIQSSFAKLLLRSSWIPTLPVMNPETGGKTEKRLLPPDQVFLCSPRLYSFLNNHVPYLDGNEPESKTLLCFLNIRDESVLNNVTFIYDMLQSWCMRGINSNSDEVIKSGASFTTSVEHLMQVYVHLQMHSTPDQLSKFFENFPAIFLPSEVCDQHRILSGKFIHKSRTYWEDPTTLFHKYGSSSPRDRVSVMKIYGPTSDFFQKHLKIDDTPTMLEYLQLLVKITSEYQLPNINVHTDIMKIFAILGEKCAIPHSTYGMATDIDANMASFLKNNLKGYKVFPTKSNKWVCLEDQPMIVDEGSEDMEKLFSSHQDIHFLLENAGENTRSKSGVRGTGSLDETRGNRLNIKRFLKACDVTKLADFVEREPIEEFTKLCPKLKNLMHYIVPYVQTFLFSKFDEIHENLVSKVKIKAKLKIMNFMTASRLDVTYRLTYSKGGEQLTAVETVKQTCSINRNFYVSKSIEENIQQENSVRREIARFFSNGDHACQKELQSFLILALQRSNPIDDKFIKQENLIKIDEDVELWEVEKAEEPKPIPSPPKPPPPAEVTLTKEVEDSTKRLEKGEEGSGIHSWPPKSSAYGIVHSDRVNQAEEASLKQWPPPKPAQPVDVRLRPQGSNQTFISHENENKKIIEGEKSDNIAGVRARGEQHNQTLSQVNEQPTGIEDQKADTHGFKSLDSVPTSIKEGQDFQETSSSIGKSQTDVASRYGIERMPETGSNKTTEIGAHTVLPMSDLSVGSNGDMQFQTPPNPHRTATHSRTPMTFSTSPPGVVQLIEEEITPELLDLQFFDDSDISNPNDEIVGRWGEELVYHMLSNQYKDKAIVRWVNEHDESGSPYDIEIKTNDGEICCIEYIEVKATNSSEKKYFRISANEITFAQLKAPNYHLYRVYNTGKKDTVKVCSLKDLNEKMLKKQVVLLMKI